jgi:hypothetical protein
MVLEVQGQGVTSGDAFLLAECLDGTGTTWQKTGSMYVCLVSLLTKPPVPSHGLHPNDLI